MTRNALLAAIFAATLTACGDTDDTTSTEVIDVPAIDVTSAETGASKKTASPTSEATDKTVLAVPANMLGTWMSVDDSQWVISFGETMASETYGNEIEGGTFYDFRMVEGCPDGPQNIDGQFFELERQETDYGPLCYYLVESSPDILEYALMGGNGSRLRFVRQAEVDDGLHYFQGRWETISTPTRVLEWDNARVTDIQGGEVVATYYMAVVKACPGGPADAVKSFTFTETSSGASTCYVVSGLGEGEMGFHPAGEPDAVIGMLRSQ